MNAKYLESKITGLAPATRLRLTFPKENPYLAAARLSELNIIRFHLDPGVWDKMQLVIKRNRWATESDRIVTLRVNSMFEPGEFVAKFAPLLQRVKVL